MRVNFLCRSLEQKFVSFHTLPQNGRQQFCGHPIIIKTLLLDIPDIWVVVSLVDFQKEKKEFQIQSSPSVQDACGPTTNWMILLPVDSIIVEFAMEQCFTAQRSLAWFISRPCCIQGHDSTQIHVWCCVNLCGSVSARVRARRTMSRWTPCCWTSRITRKSLNHWCS